MSAVSGDTVFVFLLIIAIAVAMANNRIRFDIVALIMRKHAWLPLTACSWLVAGRASGSCRPDITTTW